MPEQKVVVTTKATLGVCVKEDGTLEVTVKSTEGEACVAVCEQPVAQEALPGAEPEAGGQPGAKPGGGGAEEEAVPA